MYPVEMVMERERFNRKVFEAFWNVLPAPQKDRSPYSKSVVLLMKTGRDFSFGIESLFGTSMSKDYRENEELVPGKYIPLKKGDMIQVIRARFEEADKYDGHYYNILMDYVVRRSDGSIRSFGTKPMFVSEETRVTREDLMRFSEMISAVVSNWKRPVYPDLDFMYE